MWGSNVPITRAPDAHFMTEARYKGQKTVVVSPDYSDHTKFADHWLPVQPGTDGALAMAMGHVILKEFYVDRQVPYFVDYAKKYTDLPMLVTLRKRDGAHLTDRFLHAVDLGEHSENAEWKTAFIDARTGEAVVPNGSMGFKYGEEGAGKWNLQLKGSDPALTLLGRHDELVAVDLPRFDLGETDGGGTVMRRGVPAKRVGGQLVTTVFDLMLAQYGVGREGLPGEWPGGYDDPEPYTPSWQEEIQGGTPSLRCRGPGRAGELPAHPHPVALQPARLFRKGPRVLLEAPARRARRDDPSRRIARRAAPRGGDVARGA
jgi:nitrate reductase / nitrite oxidoreductase, alpha subunit